MLNQNLLTLNALICDSSVIPTIKNPPDLLINMQKKTFSFESTVPTIPFFIKTEVCFFSELILDLFVSQINDPFEIVKLLYSEDIDSKINGSTFPQTPIFKEIPFDVQKSLNFALLHGPNTLEKILLLDIKEGPEGNHLHRFLGEQSRKCFKLSLIFVGPFNQSTYNLLEKTFGEFGSDIRPLIYILVTAMKVAEKNLLKICRANRFTFSPMCVNSKKVAKEINLAIMQIEHIIEKIYAIKHISVKVQLALSVYLNIVKVEYFEYLTEPQKRLRSEKAFKFVVSAIKEFLAEQLRKKIDKLDITLPHKNKINTCFRKILNSYSRDNRYILSDIIGSLKRKTRVLSSFITCEANRNLSG
ncbi:hypothetical protein CDIK_3094 [Cucumispora dikerogammari]|nr:hypothetical protein CDIK_3094 [Cucumispora dikerogammari]